MVDLLQPVESVIFYVLDSHRPYDLCNVYSEDQVRILGKIDEDDEIPEYNDIFKDDSVINLFWFFIIINLIGYWTIYK